MAGFPSGDNPDRGESVLEYALRDLVSVGYVPRLPIADSTNRKFAYLINDPKGNAFYIVARSTDLFNGSWFGSQLWFIKQAQEKDRPIALWVKGRYYLFDSTRLLNGMKGTNQRGPETFGNFNALDGVAWNPIDLPYPIYRKLQGLGLWGSGFR